MKRLSRCSGTKQPNATFAGSERRFVTMETKTLTTDFPIDNDYSRFITRAPVATQASSKCGQLPLWTPTIAVTDDEVHSVFLLLQAVGCEQFTSVLRNESHFVKFRGADYISVESNKRNNQLICQNLFQHNCCSCEIKKKRTYFPWSYLDFIIIVAFSALAHHFRPMKKEWSWRGGGRYMGREKKHCPAPKRSRHMTRQRFKSDYHRKLLWCTGKCRPRFHNAVRWKVISCSALLLSRPNVRDHNYRHCTCHHLQGESTL